MCLPLLKNFRSVIDNARHFMCSGLERDFLFGVLFVKAAIKRVRIKIVVFKEKNQRLC